MSKAKRTPDSPQGEILGGRVRLQCGGLCVDAEAGLGCGAWSDFAPIISPAAPALTRAEELEKLGWSHNGGDWGAMLLGLSVLCPDCTRKAAQGAARGA